MIYLIAYCRKNLGDDMFVRTLIDRYPNEQFYLCASPNFTKPFRGKKNLHCATAAEFMTLRFVHKITRKRGRILNPYRFRMAKAVVQIGGSIFIEHDGWKEQFSMEIHPYKFLVGCNFGPYKTESYLEAVREKIKRATDCCFRDRTSFDLFRDLPNVRYAPDVLFGCACLPSSQRGDCIGISIIDMGGRDGLIQYQDDYEKGIAEICNYWIVQGRNVKLLCLCEAEGDTDAANRIMTMVGNKQALSSFAYTGNVDGFLAEMNTCEVLYATRFHAMVLGWAMHKKVFPIIYSVKQQYVLEDIGYQGGSWNIVGGQLLREVHFDEPIRMDENIVHMLAEKSLKEFQGIDAFIATGNCRK